MINTVQNKTDLKTGFKGGFLQGATSLVTKGVRGIEHGGVLVDFCVVDAISMVIPRTYQAYHRNEEELGQPNYKAGKEELIRELLSGPSVYFVPAACVALAGALAGKATGIRFDTLNSLTRSYKNTLEHGKFSKEDFYRGVLNEAFAPHRQIKLDKPVKIDRYIDKIVKNLSKVENGDNPKKAVETIKRLTSVLNKAHGINIGSPRHLTLADGLDKCAGVFAKDLTKYAKDIVEKTAGKPELLDKLHRSRVWGRRGTIAAAIAATSTVLYSVPLLYKRNKQYPGIDGLVLDRNGKMILSEPVSSVALKGNNAANDEKQKDKKEVAFGANPASKAEGFFNKFDFREGANVPYKILAFFTFGMMLGMRLLQARNEDERREVATRDFSGLLTITFAVPIFRNLTAAIAKKISGIPIAKPIKSALGYINPNNKPFSFENIGEVYSGVSKYKNGIVDFAENIHKHGGNLGKALSVLTDKSKNALNQILPGFANRLLKVPFSDSGYRYCPCQRGNKPCGNDNCLNRVHGNGKTPAEHREAPG